MASGRRPLAEDREEEDVEEEEEEEVRLGSLWLGNAVSDRAMVPVKSVCLLIHAQEPEAEEDEEDEEEDGLGRHRSAARKRGKAAAFIDDVADEDDEEVIGAGSLVCSVVVDVVGGGWVGGWVWMACSLNTFLDVLPLVWRRMRKPPGERRGLLGLTCMGLGLVKS